MTIHLNPAQARFIEQQVLTGLYGSPDEAVNAVLARLQAEDELLSADIDENDLAAIEEGLTQLNRGEGIPLGEARSQLRTLRNP
jgi:Arc/MetJ-type ribon-helix-helix transcriptional regulator